MFFPGNIFEKNTLAVCVFTDYILATPNHFWKSNNIDQF